MSNQTPEQRAALALPSAREIHAVRFTNTEVRIDKHGREQMVTVTVPWPEGFSVRDVLGRVRQAGLRYYPSAREVKRRRRLRRAQAFSSRKAAV